MQTVIVENTWLNRSAIAQHGWGNGYVLIPKGHKFYGLDYDEIHSRFNINVHGGLTYSSHIKDMAHNKPFASYSDQDFWVVGFDTAHYADRLETWPYYRVLEEAQNLAKQIEAYA